MLSAVHYTIVLGGFYRVVLHFGFEGLHRHRGL